MRRAAGRSGRQSRHAIAAARQLESDPVKRSTASILTLLALTSSAPAQASREDLDAAAALALSARRPAPARSAADLTKPLTLDQAIQVAKTRRVPVLVRVGAVDCAHLCVGLRPEIPTCHAAELWGDAAPRLQLIYTDGTAWWGGERWKGVPSEAAVRTEAKRLQDHASQLKVQAPPTSSLPAPLWGNCPASG